MLELARRMTWWKQPEEALLYPDRLLAQVLAIGAWDDAYPRKTVTRSRMRFTVTLIAPPSAVHRRWR
jgi:hypothetical protein